ncbi:Helicase associated domain protein [Cyanobium sp. T1G-Tous]|uniref:DEAD/DEAH box helicase n=1 Tax=Cyanobium sp. T1G-Tous TaxID=2823722 RepID=UPI0020CDD0D6|nr:DEAD/DEAH box helicase [Cyanobium sp. T1G-Tous]MCP9803102.1 Helicase associated domain protein [Cyanobium sp. T1G-Tous]
MATFDEFYRSLPDDSGKRGEFFEKVFVPWFLREDPEWSTKIQKIWLWDEYPDRWGKDCGIDLVYEDRNGKHWAVQSKCVSPDREISKAEIDSFLSESNDPRIHGRLLIASTDGIGKNAMQVIERQEKQVVCFLREHFRQSEVEFPSTALDLATGRRKDKRRPRPHQQEAIRNVVEGLKTQDRGQLLMACGTGKTLTSLWIKEELNAKRTLVLLPSLSLLSQTLREWTATSREEFNWICVCSDKSVAKQDKSVDDWIEHVTEVGVPVTSDPAEIRQFLSNNEEGIIFSTYQSCPLVTIAQQDTGIPSFDVVFADEAHRCAGKVSESFGCVLDSQKIRAQKRLFMTATPRVLSNQIKTKADAEDIEVASMDDENLFGTVLHRLNFSEAISKELLTDYRVVVIGVDDPEIQAQIIHRPLSATSNGVETDYETLANHISLAKAIREYDLQRVITFHGRVKGAKKFSEDHPAIVDWLPISSKTERAIQTGYVSGEMTSLERNNKIGRLRNLKDGEIGILSNARCLSEGVDVPTLDGIAFIDPRSSQVDIIQAVGRAIRKSEEKSFGYIILPVYISSPDEIEEELFKSRFAVVWKVLLSLRSQDDTLDNQLDKLRIELGKRNNLESTFIDLGKIHIDLPKSVSNGMESALKALIVKSTTSAWFEKYGELLDYVEENGSSNIRASHSSLGEWVVYQRKQFRKYRLPQKECNLLSALPEWSWDPIEGAWQSMYLRVKEYSENRKLDEIPICHEYYSWIGVQRSRYKQNKLKQEWCEKLTSLPGWQWDPREDEWRKRFNEAKGLCETNANKDSKQNNYQWANWQRLEYRKGKLSEERISMLNSITGWSWNPEMDIWEKNYRLTKENIEIYGFQAEAWSERRLLLEWLKNQFKRSNENELSEEQASKINRLNFPRIQRREASIEMPEPSIYIDETGKLIIATKSHVSQVSEQINIIEGKIKVLIETLPHAWERKLLEEADSLDQIFKDALRQVREAGKKGVLSQTQQEMLDKLSRCILNKDTCEWKLRYEELSVFWESNAHLRLPEKHLLTYWATRQRQNYAKGILEGWKITELEKLPFWSWDPLFSKWLHQYESIRENLTTGRQEELTTSSKTWITNQRRYRQKLSDYQTRLLENLPGWQWDPSETRWIEMYTFLVDHVKTSNTLKVPAETQLSYWVARQRQMHRKGMLPRDKQELLDDIPGWDWLPKEKRS